AIAAERRGQLADSRISLNQMMAAIQRANPEAFIRGDANRLKRGSVLRLPDERQTRALLPEDSANLLNSQWARKVQAQPAPVLDAANRLGRGADSAPARKPAGAAPNNQGRLKIVPTVGNMNTAGSQSGASRSGQGNELRSENAAGAEEIAARQVEIANLRKQLDEAAKLQTESKRLIELQNSQIKQLTERMQQIEKGAPAAPVAATGQAAAETAAPWYASPFVSIAGLLLIAGLAGALLIRRRR
ncbi:MAG: FimV/HubP family polar landmark protein, partial [Arenimonas sp.]